MASQDGSITRLIPFVRMGNPLAIEQLWRRYVTQVETAVRPMMAGVSAGAGDAEDVSQSAFHAFLDAATSQRLEHLEGRDELWRLLVTIARRKATDRIRRQGRQRRGRGVRNSSEGLEQATSRDSTSSQIVQLQELLDRLMANLDATGDVNLKAIALSRLAGATNDEIAQELQCSSRTIQRKLHILERMWTSSDD